MMTTTTTTKKSSSNNNNNKNKNNNNAYDNVMTLITEAAVSRTRTTEWLFMIYVLTKQPSVQLLSQQDYKKTTTTHKSKKKIKERRNKAFQ